MPPIIVFCSTSIRATLARGLSAGEKFEACRWNHLGLQMSTLRQNQSIALLVNQLHPLRRNKSKPKRRNGVKWPAIGISQN